MSKTEGHFAVMFADVSGSTRLYETLGDKDAKAAIGATVDLMSELTTRHGGTVIKTIGDEVMSRFPTADAGIQAACGIQEALEDRAPLRNGSKVAVRIGVHWGPALLENGDVFGDAVNIAARMAGIAKARQIITTEETVRKLNADLAGKARVFDRTQVKGKQTEIVIHEVVWEEQEDVTRITAVRTAVASDTTATRPLMVRCGNTEKPVANDGLAFVLGRADTCNLVVPSTLASRQHARIEFRRGKYILIDQSTNGTWVRMQDGKDVYLRREELPLWGKGLISLGEEVRADNPAAIHFRMPE
ncbi:MAG: adenylate/guanylate cyclase domain-containing protein [Pseudomonadota bacterium]